MPWAARCARRWTWAWASCTRWAPRPAWSSWRRRVDRVRSCEVMGDGGRARGARRRGRGKASDGAAMTTSRRSFLKGAFSSTALVALAPAVPQFLVQASARAAENKGETILVVVQLSGGNDGLNTVIPYADDVYRKSRPSLAVAASNVLKIDDRVAL